MFENTKDHLSCFCHVLFAQIWLTFNNLGLFLVKLKLSFGAKYLAPWNLTSLNYFVDLFKVISGTSFNSSWHLLKISPFLIIPGTSFTYIGYLLKLLAPLAKVGTFYIIFVFVSWWGTLGGILGVL